MAQYYIPRNLSEFELTGSYDAKPAVMNCLITFLCLPQSDADDDDDDDAHVPGGETGLSHVSPYCRA
jgi:hypothetical protein